MTQPEGFVDSKAPHLVCCLQKGLYGIKQVGKIWHDAIHATILELGFSACKYNPCIYWHCVNGRPIFMSLHVDNFCCVGVRSDINVFTGELKKCYSIKHSPATLCLGIQITHNKSDGSILISQSGYVSDLVT